MNMAATSTAMMNGGAITVMSTVQTIFTFFFLCMNAWILYYLTQMRSICKHCADDWQIPVIIVALSILMIHLVLSIFQKMPGYTNMVFFVIWAIFVALTLRLIYGIKDSKCKCAKERNVTLMEQFMYINAFLLVLLLLMASVLSTKDRPKFFNGGTNANMCHSNTNISRIEK